MRHVITAALCAFAATAHTAEYRTIKMQIDIEKPAAEVWAKVGGYCDTSWADLNCRISSGDGGIGTVRVLGPQQITEIMVGKTELSYGYTQPLKEGQFYNLYHGYLEARPIGSKRTRLLYTLVYDVSDKPDESAKQADMDRRRTRFEGALRKMKEISEH